MISVASETVMKISMHSSNGARQSQSTSLRIHGNEVATSPMTKRTYLESSPFFNPSQRRPSSQAHGLTRIRRESEVNQRANARANRK